MKAPRFLVLLLFITAALQATATAAATPSLASTLDKGHAALAKGNAKSACKLFEKAVELSSGSSYAAYLGLASARLGAGQPKEALAAATAAEKLGADASERAAASYLAGMALFRLDPPSAESLAEAKAALERAISLDPDKAFPAKQTLAQLEAAAGDHAKAIGDIRDSIGQLPLGSSRRTDARILLCQLLSRFPSQATSVEGSLQPDESIQKPVGLFQPVPRYPIAARANNVQGGAVYQAIIDRDGCVRDLTNLHSDDEDLERISRETVAQWVFEPATLNGQAVPLWYHLKLNFSLSRTL
jgi:TonB family protein